MDLRLIETLNGGDLLLQGNDLAVINSFENQVYLALFGGNPQGSTPATRPTGQQAADFWGNYLESDPSVQFNSLTERTLNTTELTSAGRLIIEEAIKTDLQFMQGFANISISTRIIATDQLEINIGLQQPNGQQNQQFSFIWNAALQSLFADGLIAPPKFPSLKSFQYTLQMEF